MNWLFDIEGIAMESDIFGILIFAAAVFPIVILLYFALWS